MPVYRDAYLIRLRVKELEHSDKIDVLNSFPKGDPNRSGLERYVERNKAKILVLRLVTNLIWVDEASRWASPGPTITKAKP